MYDSILPSDVNNSNLRIEIFSPITIFDLPKIVETKIQPETGEEVEKEIKQEKELDDIPIEIRGGSYAKDLKNNNTTVGGKHYF